MLYLHLYLSQCFYFYIYYSRVILNWKHDRRDLAFEASPLPLEWRRRLNAQIELECSWVQLGACEAARAAGQRRRTGRETEAIWRDKTSSDMTCWSGSKHGRYSAEPRREHASLPPSSLSGHFLLFSYPSVSLSHFCHSPPPTLTPPHHNLGLSLSHSPPQSRQLRLN